MKRREFITLLGGTAAMWPLAAHAQRGERVRRIAVLMSNVEDDPEAQARTTAFRQGLQELGWSEGQNLHIDWLWSGGDVGRIRGYATEVAALAPDLVVANGAANLSAIKEAIRKPGIIDEKMVAAQRARRVLDRLVGYKISPLLWDKVRRGLSAGRVQSVALKLVCDR